MSKEQTPITAREFIPKNDNGLYSRRQVEKHAEEYAQAKVLEALERVEDKLYQEKYNPTGHYLFDVIEITNIIEEVKPKYE